MKKFIIALFIVSMSFIYANDTYFFIWLNKDAPAEFTKALQSKDESLPLGNINSFTRQLVYLR